MSDAYYAYYALSHVKLTLPPLFSLRYYVDNNVVIIKSKPSAALSESLEKTEKARIAAQKQELGQPGIEKVTKLLEDAKKEHETPIPSDILTSFPVPDVKSITWIPVKSFRNDPSTTTTTGVDSESDLASHIKSDGKDLPLFVHYLDVKVGLSFRHIILLLRISESLFITSQIA